MRSGSTTIRRRTGRRGRRALASTLAGAVAITAFGLAAPTAAQAVDVPAPSAHYDMSHSGTSLLDVSGNGRNATLTSLTDSSFVKVGANDDVLRFKADGYASLPKGLVTGTDNDFTVEYTVTTQTAANHFGWVIGDGVGPWNTTTLGNHVFLSPDSAQAGYTNQVLAAIRVKGTDNGESRMPAGGGLNPGFTTLTMVGSGNTLTLYRDGAVISTLTHTKSMSSIIPSGNVLGYLGRSLYQGDPLLRADVTDVKFWDSALSAGQVTSSMPTATEKAASTDGIIRLDITPTVLGPNPSLDQVTSNLSLPASSNGIALTWASSNPAVVSTSGVVSRSISSDTPVTLTATTSLGTTIPLDVVVKAPNVAADLSAISLATRTTENLPLAIKGSANGAAITWTSSDPALVTPTNPSYTAPAVGAADPFAGGGIVTRPAYGSGDKNVTLTATATLNGQTQTRTFAVTVAEKGRSAPDAGYASAYFKSDSDEKIYQAATSGNDFFTFSPVNGGNAVITSTADTKGLRDPYILRSKDGDKYYMVATDLCISCGTGWGPAQSAGSLKIEVWESTDLVHWARTNGANTGITINKPEAGMTWAPEAYWDDALQSYVVFFSSRMYADSAHTNSDNLYARVFYVLTRDFKTFTYPPASWQDTGYARIDSTVTKIGDYYYRFTKNEESGAAGVLEAGKDIFLERSKVLTAPTTQSNWSADPNSTWQLLDTRMTSLETGQSGEGPEIVRLNAGDPNNNAAGDGYVFLVDNYGAGGYRAFVTSGSAISSSTQANRLSQRAEWNVRPVGGLPASPRHGAFVSVTQSVLDALHGWTNVAAVGSTTKLTADGRALTAKVTAADGGQVVGTVTFSGGSWSKTVTLSNASASVEAPAGVGSVTAHYDGYSDGLVSASTSSAVSLSLDISATAVTRCVTGKVTEGITVTNNDDVTATITIAGAYGSKTVSLAAGKSTSATFATRLVSITADQVSITAQSADGRSLSTTVTVAAAACS
ncbi:immunoglobulin-like domain-containing protein [Microbacterium sp. AZCO]|uniref:immunoglobulin-like domain-containing protein n=1 Tax=Microbacterium sp. AZCO TaxID=3142976 RepID=UPI0031F3C463